VRIFETVLRTDARELLPGLNSELDGYGFYPAGGSGLALQLGHRVSDDLGFFTIQEFLPEAVSDYLAAKSDYVKVLLRTNTLYCTVRGVKLSFIRHEVPLVFPTIPYRAVRVADWRDIIADKSGTLAARGSRKDFYDIYVGFAVGNLTVVECAGLIRRRFAAFKPNYYHMLRSLVFFDDAEAEPELTLLQPLEWSRVKEFFVKNLKEFEKHLLQQCRTTAAAMPWLLTRGR
jgi:hypothetical protein